MRKFFANPVNILGLLLIIAFSAFSVLAQDSSAAAKLKNNLNDDANAGSATAAGVSVSEGKNELSVQGGFAPDIPRVFGGSRRSKFGFAALRYSRRLIGSENVALKYTVDFIPLAIINYDRRPIVQTAPNTFVTQQINTTAYAVGLTPVGFQLNFRRKSKVQPFFSASAGIIFFNKSIPDDRSAVFPEMRGRQFNFTLAGGGGLEFATDSGRSYTAGFKFHHISNASTGNINPGFDQNLFYFGYTFKKW